MCDRSECSESLTFVLLLPHFLLFAEQSHLNLFANRPQPKKKRKSRTAFTNHQIFELEKRFLYQKYLSPSDRDEIAAALGLSNAQVGSPSFSRISSTNSLSLARLKSPPRTANNPKNVLLMRCGVFPLFGS